MNTTLLFAELLIIGLQAGIWVFLLALNIFGVTWINQVQQTGLSDWQTIIVAILLSVFYVLGIIVDRLADAAFVLWNKKITKSIIPDPPLPIVTMRFEAGKDNEYLNRQFEYTRSRMRISRASSFNFAISTILTGVFIFARLPNVANPDKWGLFSAALIFGLFLTISSVYTWHRLTRTYLLLVKSTYAVYLEEKKESLKKKKASKLGD